MEVITYCLKNNNLDSDIYYKKTHAFTDEVLSKFKNMIYKPVKEFQNYIKENKVEEVRSFEEYAIELLTLGVLWQCYICNAKELKYLPRKTLIFVSDIRKKSNSLKPKIDFIKGKLISKYLKPSILNRKDNLELNIESLDILLNWLKASGDFEQEVKRLINWRKYLCNENDIYIKNTISTALCLAEWFKNRSKLALGNYTFKIDEFLKNTYLTYKDREDMIFCGRREVEYHLNMVGAEIMNRAFREKFLKTNKKRVLLPGCMRIKGDKCKALKNSYGYVCAECNSNCPVKQVTDLGKKNKFEVLIINHESDAFSNDKVKNSEVGIVGVACVLNLISGGWKAKGLDFVPQCVILDYCGCKNHWHRKGIITDINIEELKKIICI